MSRSVTCPNCGSRMQGLAKQVREEKGGALYTVFRCSKREMDRSTGRVKCADQLIYVKEQK